MVQPLEIIALAFFANLPIGLISIQKGSLTMPDGFIMAGMLGFTLFLAHPFYWSLMIVFFISSTLLSKFKEADPRKLDAIQYAEKGSQRDGLQVIANGGIPFIIAIINMYEVGFWQLSWDQTVLAGVAFAVVNADTWATELGVMSETRPFWILNPRKRVPRGTSGGVSPLGLLATSLGSLVIAASHVLGYFLSTGILTVRAGMLILLGGILGSLIDSFLGATVQGQYYCSVCEKTTEKRLHLKCSTLTVHKSGLRLLTNDFVNILAVVGAVIVILPFLW